MRYFEDDFFDELLREAGDLRAVDFAADFFAPALEVVVEREVLSFLAAPAFAAPAFEAPDFEVLFDELFLLVAGDFAIADILSFPSEKRHGIRISRHGEETTKWRLPSNCAQFFVKFIHWLFRLGGSEAAIDPRGERSRWLRSFGHGESRCRLGQFF